jgi:lactoylglutathione lyase
MASFTFDHIHLRSPDPEATAAFYERIFGVELRRSPQRIDFMLGGQAIFVSPITEPATGEAPTPPYRGLEHIGLAVTDIDGVGGGAEGQGRGLHAWSRTTIRPGVRIAFLRAPENVSIELLERSMRPR